MTRRVKTCTTSWARSFDCGLVNTQHYHRATLPSSCFNTTHDDGLLRRRARSFGVSVTISSVVPPTSPPARFLVRMVQEHLDARLTELGKQQCATLKATNHGVEKEAELVVVSPLTRAIQTAMLTIDQARICTWRERDDSCHCGDRHVCRPIHWFGLWSFQNHACWASVFPLTCT